MDADDARAVDEAMAATGTTELADRAVDELSGGQRQRVWLAMALAQETELLLLDEPTTYLDLAHQVEVLELVAELNATRGRTVVMVLHDLPPRARRAGRRTAVRRLHQRVGRPLLRRPRTPPRRRPRGGAPEPHVGGQPRRRVRFAANLLVLPDGVVHGGTTPQDGLRIAAAAVHGRVDLPGLRGRTGASPCAGTAEVVLRRHLQLDGLDDMHVLDERPHSDRVDGEDGPEPAGTDVLLRTGSGLWRAVVRAVDLGVHTSVCDVGPRSRPTSSPRCPPPDPRPSRTRTPRAHLRTTPPEARAPGSPAERFGRGGCVPSGAVSRGPRGGGRCRAARTARP